MVLHSTLQLPMRRREWSGGGRGHGGGRTTEEEEVESIGLGPADCSLFYSALQFSIYCSIFNIVYSTIQYSSAALYAIYVCKQIFKLNVTVPGHDGLTIFLFFFFVPEGHRGH